MLPGRLEILVRGHRHQDGAATKIQLKKMPKPSTVTEPPKPVTWVKPLALSQACWRYNPIPANTSANATKTSSHLR